MANMLDAWATNLKRAFDFSGRTGRASFWWTVLTNMIVIFALAIGAGLFAHSFLGTLFKGLYAIYVLVWFIPDVAMLIRRLHDIGRSGWWILLSFIPIIGTIVLIVWQATQGNDGDNTYGASVAMPK